MAAAKRNAPGGIRVHRQDGGRSWKLTVAGIERFIQLGEDTWTDRPAQLLVAGTPMPIRWRRTTSIPGSWNHATWVFDFEIDGRRATLRCDASQPPLRERSSAIIGAVPGASKWGLIGKLVTASASVAGGLMSAALTGRLKTLRSYRYDLAVT